MKLPIYRSIKEFAAEQVNNWRASDGGLTEDACEVIHLGAACDKLLNDPYQSRMSKVNNLERWAIAQTTQAGLDVIDHALELV